MHDAIKTGVAAPDVLGANCATQVPYPARRRWLQKASVLGLSAGGLGSCLVGIPLRVHATSVRRMSAHQNSLALQWRVLSRLGYGPNEDLLGAVQSAGDPQDWALQNLMWAQQASRVPAKIAEDLYSINAPLPEIFKGAQLERQARASAGFVAPASAAPGSPEFEAAARLRRLDFSEPHEASLFNQTQVAKAAVWRVGASSQPEVENPLLARMTEFWFNHFNIYANKGSVRPFVGHYLLNAIRNHALGKFEDLLLATARHPAMLLYLDQSQSVASNGRRAANGAARGLNENYARELLELHTLGVDGGYSQSDVRNLARVLTGWTLGPNAADGFRFVAAAHDTDPKTVLGTRYAATLLETGETEGIRVIRFLASHPATAQRICLRLAKFFVADTPQADLVQSLKTTFIRSGGDIAAVMQTLIQSADFWAAENRLFKTPLDYAFSALTALGGVQDRRMVQASLGFLNNAGQPLHNWQTPDGYATDAATWLAPEALTRRADYALLLGRAPADLEFLQPFLSSNTRQTVALEPAAMRNGLLLASPEFMYK